MSAVRIIDTGDGSHSLFHEALNETYHSHHGALQESRHVFIDAGLAHFTKEYPGLPVRIFEMGFGTGLNVLLAALWAREHQIPVFMLSIEAFPLDELTVAALNYPRLLDNPHARTDWKMIHAAPWGNLIAINEFFTFRRIHCSFEKMNFDDAAFSVVFYDAFAPSRQPALWDIGVFDRLKMAMRHPSVLVTYCAQGQFKRNLITLGMRLETLAGPPGKKEMVRASL